MLPITELNTMVKDMMTARCWMSALSVLLGPAWPICQNTGEGIYQFIHKMQGFGNNYLQNWSQQRISQTEISLR